MPMHTERQQFFCDRSNSCIIPLLDVSLQRSRVIRTNQIMIRVLFLKKLLFKSAVSYRQKPKTFLQLLLPLFFKFNIFLQHLYSWLYFRFGSKTWGCRPRFHGQPVRQVIRHRRNWKSFVTECPIFSITRKRIESITIFKCSFLILPFHFPRWRGGL